MKQVFRHIIPILLAIVLVNVAIQSVLADPEKLDDYPFTHHTAQSQAGGIQHFSTFHFDNLVYLHADKLFFFENGLSRISFFTPHIQSEFAYAAPIWQPPKFI